MVIIKKFRNNKRWRGYGGKGTLLHSWWKCGLVHPLQKAEWRVFEELGIKLPYDPAIPLLGIYSEKTISEKETGTSMFTAALFAIAKTWKKPRCL